MKPSASSRLAGTLRCRIWSTLRRIGTLIARPSPRSSLSPAQVRLHSRFTEQPAAANGAWGFVLPSLLLLGLLLATSVANATQGYFDTWVTTYPGSASDNNASCQLCHGQTTQSINPYGLALAQCNGATGGIIQRIQAAEGLNSDGDPGGFSNLAEINANTQPGWTTGAVPVWGRNNCVSSGTNTYPGSGAVDPVAPVPNIAVNPTTLSFGIVDEGNSNTLTTTIQNTGTATLTVTALNLTGTTEFSLGAAPATPFNVAAGASATVDVVYTPLDNGTDTGSLTISSNDPDSPTVVVNLTGTGNVVVPNACNFAINPASLSFGSVIVGNTSTLQTTVTNNGTAACNITAGVTGSAEFSASPLTVTVAANGGTAIVSVDYTPVDAGADVGNLNLSSDDVNNLQSVDIPLSGSGSVPAGDFDQDGVPDNQDNCIERSTPISATPTVTGTATSAMRTSTTAASSIHSIFHCFRAAFGTPAAG